MFPLGKDKTPEQVNSIRVCHLRTIFLPPCRMADSRDKMVPLLLCCIMEMPKGVEKERVREKWNTLWKQACTSDERNPLPCQSQLLPKSATEGGKKKQPQKNSTEPTPPPFLCVPLSHTVYCKRPIPFYLEACNISVNNHFSFRCAAPSLCTQPGVVFSLFLHLKAPGVKLVTDEHWLLPQRRWKSRMKVSCALKSCTSDFPGLFKVTRQHRGTLRLILCPLSEGRLQ